MIIIVDKSLWGGGILKVIIILYERWVYVMDNQTANKAETNKMKKVIIILIVLLLISGIGLAARYLYLKNLSDEPSTSTAPGNTIGENVVTGENEGEVTADDSSQTQVSGNNGANEQDEVKEAVKLEFHQSKTDDNTKFEVRNMFPGDTVSKSFEIKVYHKNDIELFFDADVTEQIKNLADVLNIKLIEESTGSVLMDKPFALADGEEVSKLLKAEADEQTTVRFRIDVSLDQSVGNEYQNALLKADFKWYVKDDGSLVKPPKTEDKTDIILWILIADIALMLSLVIVYKKKGGECHE